MTESNFTDPARRELLKYRVTFGASLAVLVLAGVLFYLAYDSHGFFLNTGDRIVAQAIRSGVLPAPANVQKVHHGR